MDSRRGRSLTFNFFRFPFDVSRSSSSRGGAVEWITMASVKTRTYLELCIIKGCGGGLVVSAVVLEIVSSNPAAT